jgi:hypothetical protein
MCHFVIIGTRRNSVAYNVTFFVVIYIAILQTFLSSFNVSATFNIPPSSVRTCQSSRIYFISSYIKFNFFFHPLCFV